jgi:hypothetical protein
MSLDLKNKLEVGVGKLLRGALSGAHGESVERGLDDMRRLDVVSRGVWIRRVVVVRVELNSGDVLLEKRDRNRAWKFLAPAPDKIEPLTQNRREGINILIPRAIEVAEKQQVIVLQIFSELPLTEKRKSIAGYDHPSGKFNERQVDEVLLHWLDMPQGKEYDAQNPRLPWFHGSDGIHRIHFSVDIAHWFSYSVESANYAIVRRAMTPTMS